ncbi:hypothetical protein ACWGH8_03265 [Nonomuraea muscovyensis]
MAFRTFRKKSPKAGNALDRAQVEGLAYVILDGTLIPIGRRAEQTGTGTYRTRTDLDGSLSCMGWWGAGVAVLSMRLLVGADEDRV